MRFLDALATPSRSRSSEISREGMTLADAYFGAGNQLGGFTTFSVGGQTYTVPIMSTMPGQKAEAIGNSFEGYVLNGLMGNSVIFGLAAVRLRVFSEARFMFQRMSKGRPADLWSDQSLALLDHPWPGGVTGDLLAIMILHADFAGNAYIARIVDQLVALRPDWVEIVLASRDWTDTRGRRGTVGLEKVGYFYYQGGKASGVEPMMFGAEDVAHFAPMPDPLASYRGMSWLTPVIREIRSDNAAMDHKLAFFANAATPNLAISLPGISDPDQFEKFIDKMDEKHKGVANAYKTLYLGGGADVTVIGASLKDMDFSTVQGKGETRLAAAAGVPPAVAGLSEGLQGSSLNAGNFGQARRQFADMTLSPMWRNAAGSLETVIGVPDSGSRLWYDIRDIPFLREDQKDLAGIQQQKAQAIRELFQAGFTAESSVIAINNDDLSLLVHTGVFSVQVQTPGMMSPKMPSNVNEPPAGPDVAGTDQQAAPASPSQPALPPPKSPLQPTAKPREPDHGDRQTATDHRDRASLDPRHRARRTASATSGGPRPGVIAGLHLDTGNSIFVDGSLLPIVASEKWVRARKVAKAYWHADVGPSLRPLIYTDYPHKVDGPARCLNGIPAGNAARHPAPQAHCSCGFYAMLENGGGFEQIRKETRFRPNALILDVELGGTVVECDKGWRAGWQRILRIYIPERCRYHESGDRRLECGERAVAMAMSTTVTTSYGAYWGPSVNEKTSFIPVCEAHVNDTVYTPATLANHFGTEVAWWPTPIGELTT